MVFELGAKSIYFDIYEPGGIGEENSQIAELGMQPTLDQLREAIAQVIQTKREVPFPESEFWSCSAVLYGRAYLGRGACR